MSDFEFKIGAYSPQTIPMARLAEYLAAFADLLGEKDRVHFADLSKGSTVINVFVEPEARVRTRQRLQEVRTAEADHPSAKPLKAINELLRNDNADGAILSGGAEIIRFPGRSAVRPEAIGPFNKPTEIEGTLVRVGGRDKTAHASVEDPEGNVWHCEVDREMARRLAPHLFGTPIRLRGDGRWQRTSEGLWELARFKPKDFELIADQSLADAIDAIRSLGIRFTPPAALE